MFVCTPFDKPIYDIIEYTKYQHIKHETNNNIMITIPPSNKYNDDNKTTHMIPHSNNNHHTNTVMSTIHNHDPTTQHNVVTCKDGYNNNIIRFANKTNKHQ